MTAMGTQASPEPVEVTVARIDEKVTTLLRQRDDHEARIRRLERWVWFATGAAAAVGSAAGSLTSTIVGG